jgi:DNA-binding NarL/FixJ family response regulator
VFELIGEGLTNRQVGDRLHLAEAAIKNYVSQLPNKLGMQRRTQAAVLAVGLRSAWSKP